MGLQHFFETYVAILIDVGSFFVCSYNIEKQAADFYTREVFSKFQKLLAKSTGYGLQYEVQGGVVWFQLVANDGVNPKVYTMHVTPED